MIPSPLSPPPAVFVSTDAGGLGLNLQAADAVVNLDLPWNPARLEQRIARVHRIGSKGTVQELLLVTKDSVEERILHLHDTKRNVLANIWDKGTEDVIAAPGGSGAFRDMVAALLDGGVAVRALRDPTRGGLAATLNEFAAAGEVGVVVEERNLPVERAVASACEMLGMDPFYVANEGKMVVVVPADEAELALEIMRADELGAKATQIGEIVENHPGIVVAKTAIGATRVVDTQVGQQLPRIC